MPVVSYIDNRYASDTTSHFTFLTDADVEISVQLGGPPVDIPDSDLGYLSQLFVFSADQVTLPSSYRYSNNHYIGDGTEVIVFFSHYTNQNVAVRMGESVQMTSEDVTTLASLGYGFETVVPPDPAAPVNTVAPAITGTLTVGDVLTCSSGTWTGYPAPTYTRVWKRGATTISGATSSTYTLQAADVGTNITCVVTATNTEGSANATSNSVGPVVAGSVAASVRVFDGVDDVITLTPPAYFIGDFTAAAVLKRNSTSGWMGIFALADDAFGSPCLTWEFAPGPEVNINLGTLNEHVEETTGTTWDSTDWQLIVVAGTLGGLASTYSFHQFDGTTWIHAGNSSNTFPSTPNNPEDWTDGAHPQLRLGNWDQSFNFFNGTMAVQALWVGTKLTNLQVEALAGGNKNTWVTAGASHLWEMKQASIATSVIDFVGSCHQAGIVGTSVATSDMSSSFYNFV